MGLRRGMGSAGTGPGFVMDEDGTFVAASLGSDFCAEHEHGIGPLTSAFGIGGDDPSRVIGIERHRATRTPDSLHLIEGEGFTCLLHSRYYEDGNDLPRELEPRKLWKGDEDYDPKDKKKVESLVTGWSDGTFGVYVRGDGNREHIRALHKAFHDHDAAIWLGGGGGDNPFGRSGLILGIVSRAPKAALEQMAEAHRAWILLADTEKKVEKKTGVKAKLAKAGCHFYACSPRLRGPESFADMPTEFDVVYWLNPQDQQSNHYGYVSVEDLLAWAKGEGPIPGAEGHSGIEWHIGQEPA
jgi:hypothetical protein